MLTQARLKELLHYNRATGLFTWAVDESFKKRVQGKVAGTIKDGYVEIRVDYIRYRAHRLVWLYVHGVWPSSKLDHKNRNRADNRLRNLRLATNSRNAMNTSLRSDNTSGVKGVYFDPRRNKWSVEIQAHGEKFRLGRFNTKQEAVKARKAAVALLHGEYACL